MAGLWVVDSKFGSKNNTNTKNTIDNGLLQDWFVTPTATHV